MSLILHCGAFTTDWDDLDSTRVPLATDHYEPLSHRDMIEMVLDASSKVGLTPKMQTYKKVIGADVSGKPMYAEKEVPVATGVTKDEKRMFFNIEFDSTYLAHTFVVGGRNSYDKSLAAGVAAGASNIVCDNMCFSGQYTFLQKHSRGTNWQQVINESFATMPRRLEGLIKRIDELKEEEFEGTRHAQAFLLEACVKHGVVPGSDLPGIWQEFEQPSHEEFEETYSRYRMLQAFTEKVKGENSASTTYSRYLKFASLFDLDRYQNN